MKPGEETEEGPLSVREDGWCFVCGQENPVGLRLPWTYEEESARARFRPGREHQGWRGILHGGIIAALLDEAMAQSLRFAGVRGVTASLQIRYRRPVPTQGEFLVVGELLVRRGRLLRLRSRLIGAEGETLAEADGTYVRISDYRAGKISP